jgi:hypothetical protein
VTGDTGAVSADHTHHFDFMSGNCDRDLNHLHSGIPNQVNAIGDGIIAYTDFSYMTPTGKNSGPADRSLDHLHHIVGDTGGISANHSHHFTVTSAGGSADGSEARPLSITILTCIKT